MEVDYDKVDLPDAPKPKRGGQPTNKSFAHNTNKQRKFLKILRETFNFSKSAKKAGANVSTIYAYMNACPEFKKLVDEARSAACDDMEEEAYRRAVHGTAKDVYHQGQVVGKEMVYSDRLMELMLKGHKPEVYGNKQSIELTANVDVSDAKQKLLAMIDSSSDE